MVIIITIITQFQAKFDRLTRLYIALNTFSQNVEAKFDKFTGLQP